MAEPIERFVNKWGPVARPDGPTQTLMGLDAARVKLGKAPLTQAQTFAAIQAATNREPYTPQPVDENPLAVWHNVTSDITELVKGIPQLPMAVVNTARQLVDKGPFYFEEGQNIADSPALRLFPGAFTASALLPGGVPAGQIATRPVSTALDLLPFASKAVKVGSQARLNALPIPEAPKLRVGSHQSSLALRRAMENSQLPQLSPLDRAAVQVGVAAGEGKRILPDLMANRVIQNPVSGQAFVNLRPWQIAMSKSKALGPLVNFSNRVRGMRSRIGRVESVESLAGRGITEFKEGLDFSRRLEETFGLQRANTEVWPLIREALEDPANPERFNPAFRSPLEARSMLPDDVKPFFDEAYHDLLPKLTKRTLSQPEGYLAPKVGVYKRTGDVYANKELQTLETADARLSVAQAQLKERFDTFRTTAEHRLIRTAGADAYALVRDGDLDGAYALLRERKVRAPKRTLNAMAQMQELARRVDEVSSLDLDTLRLNGAPGTRLNYGDLGKFIGHNEWLSLKNQFRSTASSATRRAKLDVSLRPATEAATGSRLWWKNYQQRFNEAKQVASKYGAQWERHLTDFRRAMDPETSTAQRQLIQGRLRNELGSDYRYLHYVLPDDPNWIEYATPELWRQNLRNLMTEQEASRLLHETKVSLAEMSKDRPYQPAYIPRVPMEKVGQIDSTTLRASNFEPEYAKRRSFDYAPMHPDIGVAVTYQTMRDHMARRGAPEMIRAIETHPMARTEPLLDQMLQAEAEMMRATGKDIDVTAYINDAKRGKNARFIQFEPDKLFPDRSPTARNVDKVWLPIEMDNVINAAVQSAFDTSVFQRLVDPVTGLFRSSVLLYSPAWHWNNVLSNAMQTALTNPRALARVPEEFRKMGGVEGMRKMMSETDIREAGLEASLRGEGEFSPQMLEAGFPGLLGAVENITTGIRHKVGGVERLEVGLTRAKTGNRLWEQIQKAHAKAGGASLGLNAFFDDLAKRANFEQFYSQEIRTLADDYRQWREVEKVPESQMAKIEKVAAERALTRTQDWLMDWSQMLPIERSLIRSVFPFYSWSSHIMRAALKFPFDHPLRVSVINALTRAEQDDWMSGYPPIFRNLLGWTPDENDETFMGLNVNSFNPFRDTGNLLTLAGILGATNPVISAVFESMGIDTLRGGPEYGPRFVYDPQSPSGQRFDGGSPIVNLADDLIPQATTIARYLGMDAGFREIEQRDPAAARRMLASGLRLPIPLRKIDLDESFARDEIKRFNDLQESVKSLDAGRVARYSPAAAELVEQEKKRREFQNLTAGQLADLVVQYKGGPPANPLSAFVTV